MNIMIIGNPNSIYIKQYIKYVLSDECNNVYLTSNDVLSEETKKYYEKYKVIFIDLYKKRGITRHIPKISTIISYAENLRKYAKLIKFDFIHIHYVGNPRIMWLAHGIIRHSCQKLIVTFWGSDILCINNKRARQIKGLMKSADTIVISTKQMRDCFVEYYGTQFNYKMRNCFFGNPIVMRAEELKQSVDRLNLPVNLPSNKFIISIGYNASSRQQHDKILNEFNKLPIEIKDNIFLLLQMGYGNDNDDDDITYLNRIKGLLNESEFESAIIDRPISIDETIALKSKVHIFVHGQTTDALSSSVLEYLYFGAVVLNPIWIHYDEWISLGIKYIEYTKFDELPNIIANYITNGEKIVNNNKQIIADNYTWNKVSYEWKKLYY